MDETRISLLGEENMFGIEDGKTTGTKNTSDNLINCTHNLL